MNIHYFHQDDSFLSHTSETHIFYILSGNGISPSTISCSDLAIDVSNVGPKVFEFDNGCKLDVSFVNHDAKNQKLRYRISNEMGNFNILRIEHGKPL